MDIKKILAEFKKDFDWELERHFDAVIKETENQDKFVAQALKRVKKITLSGGKRLRPALMYYGYIGAGGKERQKILKTAVSIEMVHAFLLIHDDIMDRDSKRHGQDTINFAYEKLGQKMFPQADRKHFGNSIAIIIGDMVAALGNRVLFQSQFSPELVIKALEKLQHIISLTVIGQTKDICMEYRKKSTEKETLKMYEYKTAKYTIEGPLQLGAILGGANQELLESFSSFAIPIGIAFQIQDDILGIFGSEKKLGKSIGSDITEEKQTLLLVRARERADASQRKVLKSLLGRADITSKEIEAFRQVLIETGSLEYARQLSRRLIKEGKTELEKIKSLNSETKNFLLGIAEYMLQREI